MLRSFKLSIPLFFIASISAACVSMQAELQGVDFPADTAILINSTAYQINTYKCAQIKSIETDGTLDCHDKDGNKSAPITPVSEWRRKLAEEKAGDTWASPKHQAFLYYMFHEGGLKQAVGGVVNSGMQARNIYSTTKGMIDSANKSTEMDAKRAQLKGEGAIAHMRGSTPAWLSHNARVVQWHLENSRYFIDQANKTNQMLPQ